MRQDQLVDYVRKALGVRSEAKIAKALGLTPAGFSQKKVRGTLDVVELRQLLVENSIDVSKFDEIILPKPKKIDEPIATPTISNAYRKVPEYNVRVSAGHGQFLTREIRISDNESNRVKGRVELKIVFPQILQEILKVQPVKHEYLLERYWAHLNELTAAMRKVQRSLGISGPKPLHGYRASYCKKLFNNGFSAPLVKRSLRHSSITTTIGYYDDTIEDMRDAIDNKYPGNNSAD